MKTRLRLRQFRGILFFKLISVPNLSRSLWAIEILVSFPFFTHSFITLRAKPGLVFKLMIRQAKHGQRRESSHYQRHINSFKIELDKMYGNC